MAYENGDKVQVRSDGVWINALVVGKDPLLESLTVCVRADGHRWDYEVGSTAHKSRFRPFSEMGIRPMPRTVEEIVDNAIYDYFGAHADGVARELREIITAAINEALAAGRR